MSKFCSRIILAAFILVIPASTVLRAIPLRSPADILKSYGIGVDEPSLIAALSDPRSRIRSLAANLLASDRLADAVPYLLEAFKAEKDEGTKFGMAQSLNSLGSPAGTKFLRRYCTDADKTEFLRSAAARDLGPAGSESCIRVVTPDLLSKSDGVRESALLYLKQLTHVPANAPLDLHAVLLAISHADPENANRKLAGEILKNLWPTEQ